MEGREDSTMLPARGNFKPIPRPKVTAEDLITEFGIGKYQLKMFILCGLCWTADAMEILLIEFLAKDLTNEFPVSASLNGFISGIVFLGMFVGAFTWGFFSDKYGRRLSYALSSLIVGTFGMLAATSPDIYTLMVFRFFVGFGFGGSHTAFTLWQEFTPIKSRGFLLLLNQIFWTLGALLEALVAWAVLPTQGWRMLMVYSSILPFVLVLFYFFIPESPRFLIVKGKHDEAAQVLRDVARANGHEFPEHCVLVLPESHQEDDSKSAFSYLFHPLLITTTLALFLIWATDTFAYYGSAFITPQFFEDTSLYTASVLTTCAEVPGIFLPMLTMDSLGRKATLGILFGVASTFFFVLAFVPDATVVLVCLCIARMCMSSAFTVTFIYTSEVYPTVIRSTGLGIASAISRLAGFGTSFAATALTKQTAGIVYGAVPLAAAVAALLLPYETAKRPMFDSIAQMVDYDNDTFGQYKDEVSYADTFEGDEENRRSKKSKKGSAVDEGEGEEDGHGQENASLIAGGAHSEAYRG